LDTAVLHDESQHPMTSSEMNPLKTQSSIRPLPEFEVANNLVLEEESSASESKQL